MLSELVRTLATSAPQIKVEVPDSDPLWATAAVAVGAALLGSAVGGYASFKASDALEVRRRRARAQIRRKAKIYTPIRAELIVLRDAVRAGTHLDYWLIVREIPPPVIKRPASLHLWKDLVEDGRAMTTTSTKVRGLLNAVDECADALNREVVEARALFAERGPKFLAEMNFEAQIANWVETDTGQLLLGDFGELNILGTPFGDGDPELTDRFKARWLADDSISKKTADVMRVDRALRQALDAAITELDDAMRRIADKYENESPRD